MDTKAQTNGSLALQENRRRVITIEATKARQTAKLRVAAYTRVSSSSEDQLNSYGAQNRYYTEYITSHEQWTLVDIYADEGITGTSAEKREDFQRLLADCRKGKIDRVITKSISRFARNTKECLEAVRELKSHGISVCFEEQKIDTAEMSSEMITAIFASIAQRESETISQNLRWSYQKRMESGRFNTCTAPYGYVLENGQLAVKEPEASDIRRLFALYLSGMQTREIAVALSKTGLRKWSRESVEYALQNERYAGSALLKKRFTTTTLPRKTLRNRGEEPMYFITGSNPPIISKDIFERASKLRREKADRLKLTKNPQTLSQTVICGHCGRWLRSRVVKGKRYMSCRTHEESLTDCPITQIREDEFYHAFCRLHYKLRCHPEILTQMASNLQAIRNHRMLWSADVIELNKRISEITSQVQMLTVLKQQGLVDPDIFISKSNELTEQLRKTKLEKERLLDTEQDEVLHRTQELIEILEHEPDFADGFDEELFGELVDKIVVESNDRLIFRLKNGLELAESIERTVR